MTDPEGGMPADLPDQVDTALRALWRGDSTAFDRLLPPDRGPHPDLGDLLAQALSGRVVPVEGLAPPAAVSGYRIIREIGHGGMGVVYEAEQLEPRRRVALKVVGGRTADEHYLRLFQREVQTLARLRHPAIAAIYDAGRTEEGRHFFVMELVEGVTLNVHMRDTLISQRQRLELFDKVCDAVQHAHEQSVIHRDLKPSNILVDATGNPHILDFGLARVLAPDVAASITSSGKVVGTLGYMSPEQAGGHSGQVDVRSDVYALGVILFELLTGQPPYDFAQATPAAAVRIICEQPPRRPSTLSPALRGDLEAIVLKAIEKDATCRYPSARALGADVRRYLAGDPVWARLPGRWYVLRKYLAKHRHAGLIGATAALVFLVAFAGVVSWQNVLRQQKRAAEQASARATVLHAQQRLERGDSAAARSEMEALAQAHPNLPEARLGRGRVHAYIFSTTANEASRRAAIEELRVGSDEGPSPWACQALLAEVMQQPELHVQAERAAPDDAEAWYLWSFTTLDLDRARGYAERAAQCEATADLACLVWDRLACLQALTGHTDEAIAAARTRAKIGGDRIKWTQFEGEILARQGRYREALERFGEVIAACPNSMSVYRIRATVYLCLREYDKAIEEYAHQVEMLKAAGTSPRWTCYQSATPLWIVGRVADAIEAYETFLRSPTISDYAVARLYLLRADHAAQLEQAGLIEPARESQRQVEEARDRLVAELERGLLAPWSVQIFECLAGRNSPEQLIAAAGDHPERLCEAYYYAGEVCRLTGRPDEARLRFQHCVDTHLAFDPDSSALDPMSEYHLALWRLDQLAGDDSIASRPAAE